MNMLHDMGYQTSIDEEKLIWAGCLAEKLFGRKLDSFVVAGQSDRFCVDAREDTKYG